MAFDLTRILYDDYLPAWFRACEAVQGTTDFDQTVTISGEGDISIYVEGSANRAVAKVYGITKLLARILLVAHNPDGTHHITDADIADDANIAEHKLNLCFRTIENPLNPGNNYQDTCELATTVNTAYDLGIQALHTGNSFEALYREFLECCLASPSYYITNNESSFPTRDSYILGSGDKVKVGNLNFEVGDIELDLGSNYGVPIIIALRFRLEDTTQLYEKGYLHSSTVIDTSTADNSTIDSFLAAPDNKVFFNAGHYYQWQWELVAIPRDHSVDDVGLPPTYTPIRGGLYKDSSGYLYFPIDIIFRYNLGLYHPRYNPLGIGILRSGESWSSISNQTDCLDQSKIAYFNTSGVECPDYSTATYDATTDTYTLGAETYYRSGVYIVGGNVPTGRPDSRYINFNADIWNIRPKKGDTAELRERIAQVIANKLPIRPLPLLIGSSSNPNSVLKTANTLQVVAFAPSVADGEGTFNEGVVVVDVDNNGDLALTDGVRQFWSDRGGLQGEGFSFVYNDSNTESRSFIAYDPSTRILTVDSTAINGQPIIEWVDSTLVDEHGNTITVTWSGIGTWTASTTLPSTVPDPSARFYGLVRFRWGKGTGTQFDFQGIVKVTDLSAQTEYKFMMATRDSLPPLGETYTGTVSPANQITLTGGSTEDDYYVGWQLLVLTGPHQGVTRSIIAYDGATRRATLDTAMPGTFTAEVSLSPLAVGEERILVDGHGRGVVGSVKRMTVMASSEGVIPLEKDIIYTSDGTVTGSIITGASAGAYVDVVFFGTLLVDGLLAYLATPNSFGNFRQQSLSGEYPVIGSFSIYADEGSGSDTYSHRFLAYTFTPFAINWVGSKPDGVIKFEPFPALSDAYSTINAPLASCWEYISNPGIAIIDSHSDYFFAGVVVLDSVDRPFMLCQQANQFGNDSLVYEFPIHTVFHLIR